MKLDAVCDALNNLKLDVARLKVRMDASASDWAKSQFESGKYPNINIDSAAGRFWLCDNDWKPFSDKHYDSKQLAESARSKVLDKARRFIK